MMRICNSGCRYRVRLLALILAFFSAVVLAKSESALEKRRQVLMEAAREAAAGISGYEDYARYLAPLPAHVVIGDEMSDYIFFLATC